MQLGADTALDRVMSSYSPSIKVILLGRRHHIAKQSPIRQQRALTISMPETPRKTRLNFASKKIDMLQCLLRLMEFILVQPERLKKDVMSHLLGCDLLHFAGHGHTDTLNPSKSSLLLEDWESDPLSVVDLLEMNLRKHNPFLAYLSACGTGEMRDESLVDESIHLISACQLAGFRHVIGTLWEVNDESCVIWQGSRTKE